MLCGWHASTPTLKMFGVGTVPPNDFQYPQPVWGSPHPTILRERTKERLIAAIRQYRVDAGIPIGNPELDYDNHQQRLQDIRDGKLPEISGYPAPTNVPARSE